MLFLLVVNCKSYSKIYVFCIIDIKIGGDNYYLNTIIIIIRGFCVRLFCASGVFSNSSHLGSGVYFIATIFDNGAGILLLNFIHSFFTHILIVILEVNWYGSSSFNTVLE